jgi:hypothetical protein
MEAFQEAGTSLNPPEEEVGCVALGEGGDVLAHFRDEEEAAKR